MSIKSSLQFRGIVCRHAICVITNQHVEKIPAKDILTLGERTSREHNLKQDFLMMHNPMNQWSTMTTYTRYSIADYAPTSKKTMNMPKTFYVKHLWNLRTVHALMSKLFLCHLKVSCNAIGRKHEGVEVQDPLLMKRKGWPREKRMQPSMRELSNPRKKVFWTLINIK